MRARWRRRLARVFGAVTAVLVAGALFEQIGAWRDTRSYPPTGKRVEIEQGRRIYIECRGAGSPTVLLEAGHQNWSPTWTAVLPRVASLTRVCSYDRAGLGWSDAPTGRRDVQAANHDLDRALVESGEKGPYVLVGHSAGGMYQRMFAASHRPEVRGLVLVDSDAPSDDVDREAVAKAPDDRRSSAILTSLVYSGVFRLGVQVFQLEVGPREARRYPDEAKVRMRASLGRMARAMNAEWSLYRSAYAEVSNERHVLGDIPLVVIGALGYRADEKDRAEWRARQESLAELSTRGRLLLLETEGHQVPLLQPQTVATAVEYAIAMADMP